MKYLPIEFAKSLDIRNIKEGHPWRNMLGLCTTFPEEALYSLKVNTDESDFKGPFKPLKTFIDDNLDNIANAVIGDQYHDNESICDVSKDEKLRLVQDMFVTYVLADLWSKNKQVYSFDPQLEDALTTSESVKIPISLLDRIPFDTFYIDFSDAAKFNDHEGSFVHVNRFNDTLSIFMLRLRGDRLSAVNAVSWNLSDKNDDDEILLNPEVDVFELESGPTAGMKRFSAFVMNAILYLCAANSEVVESETTKRTYKKSDRIRNKFSEVKIYECGCKYGQSIRDGKIQKHNVTSSSNSVGKECTRKSPIAHARRAHWHHYWTGSRNGERELILKWIPPTVVGGTAVKTVIHKCT